MCGDDDKLPLGVRWRGDGSIVAPRRDGLARWLRRGGRVETHGDLRRSLCDQGHEPMSPRYDTTVNLANRAIACR